MSSAEVKLKHPLGLHARPSAKLVQTAVKFQSEIYIEKDGLRINAKSIMELLMLAAGSGSVLKLIAYGNDENEAIQTILDLIENDQEFNNKGSI